MPTASSKMPTPLLQRLYLFMLSPVIAYRDYLHSHLHKDNNKVVLSCCKSVCFKPTPSIYLSICLILPACGRVNAPTHTNLTFMPTTNCWVQPTETTYRKRRNNCITHAVHHHVPPVNQHHIKLSLPVVHMLHWMHTFLFIHYSNSIAMRFDISFSVTVGCFCKYLT